MKKDVYKETEHNICLPFKNNSINFKYFSDIHKSNTVSKEKLYNIIDFINDSNTDYVGIGGDLIDLTNDFKDNKEEKRILINWLKDISSNYKTLISLGNHDFLKKTNNNYEYEYLKDFWEEINSINNIYLSHFTRTYVDNNVYIYMPELDYQYYENTTHDEDINVLIKTLKDDKDIITNLNPYKIKIMMIHSPYLLDNKEVLEYIKEFDIILSGHMHNGLVLPLIGKIIKNNRGIVTPCGKLFKDNCRGVKILEIDKKQIYLIISGGITKLSKNSGLLNRFDSIYPSNIENVRILSKK